MFKKGYGALALHLDGWPLSGVVVDDNKLFLPPRCVLVNEVSVHHSVAVRVAFLEHGQAGCPAVEGPLRVGIGYVGRYFYLREAVNVAVGTAAGEGLAREGVVVIVDVDVAKHKAVARRAGYTQQGCGDGEL